MAQIMNSLLPNSDLNWRKWGKPLDHSNCFWCGPNQKCFLHQNTKQLDKENLSTPEKSKFSPGHNFNTTAHIYMGRNFKPQTVWLNFVGKEIKNPSESETPKYDHVGLKTLILGKVNAGGEGDDRRWDGWMASPIRWTWIWVGFGSWWWTGRPGVLWSIRLQRVRHDWTTELNWSELGDSDELDN